MSRLVRHVDHSPRTIGFLVVVGAALAAAGTIGMAWIAGFGEVLHVVAEANWHWLPVAIAGQAVAYLGYGLAYRDVARVEDGPELEPSHVGALVATGFGIFIARGGFALDVRGLRQAGAPPRDARVRVLALGALEYLVLAPAAAATAIYVLVKGTPVSLWITLPWAILVPLGMVLGLLALRYRDRFHGRGGWREALAQALDAVYALRCMVTGFAHHGRGLAGMALYWVGDIFALWATLTAFMDHSPSVAALVLGYATGYALTRRTLPLAGAGPVEVLLPLSLSGVLIPLAPAVAAVFAYRFFNLWLPVLPAFAGLRSIRRIEKRQERRDRAHELQRAA